MVVHSKCCQRVGTQFRKAFWVLTVCLSDVLVKHDRARIKHKDALGKSEGFLDVVGNKHNTGTVIGDESLKFAVHL